MSDQRRDVIINSAQLHKEIFLKGKYTEKLGKTGNQEHSFTSDVPAHPDLRIAFNKLTPHVIALADVHDARGHVPEEKITIVGFTISGEGTAEGVSISATRELDNLKLVAINTPWQAWDDQVTPYKETSDLSLLIEECKAEVYAYLFEDKHQPDTQMSLFDANDDQV